MPKDYQPRRAKPGQTFSYTNNAGAQVDIRADDTGVIQPVDAAEEALLDGFSLPVARKVIAERKQKEGDG